MRKTYRFAAALAACLLLAGALPAAPAARAAAPDRRALATEYQEKSAGRHPSLLFTDEELPALREKTKTGVAASAYEALSAQAEAYLKLKTAPYPFAGSGISGRVLGLHVATLAFAGWLRGSAEGEKYTVQAAKILVSAARQCSLESYKKENGELAVGDFGCAFAVGYDWLCDMMTEEERALVLSRITEIGDWIYAASVSGTEGAPFSGAAYWAQDTPARAAWNWNTVIHTALALCAMATGTHADWLSRALERIDLYCTYAKNADGMPQEGLSYTGYGMRFVVLIDATLAARCGVSLIDDHPEVLRYSDYFAWATLPDGTGAINTNQSNSFGNPSVLLYLASRSRDPAALWATMYSFGILGGGTGKLTSIWSVDGFDLPQMIVFADPTLTPAAPAEGGMKNFDGQEVLIRSGFSAEDAAHVSLVSLRVGERYPEIWHHPDAGSVTFHALGASFLIDPGAGVREASEHNGLLYNGGGPETSYRASLTRAEPLGDGWIAAVNTRSVYDKVKMRSASRTIFFRDGDTLYLLLLDLGECAKEIPAKGKFRAGKGCRLEKTDGGMLIRADGAVCRASVFSPAQAELAQLGVGFTVALPDAGTHFLATLFCAAPNEKSLPAVRGVFDEDGALSLTITRTDADGTVHTDAIRAASEGTVEYETAAAIPETTPAAESTAAEATATEAEDETPAPVDTAIPAPAAPDGDGRPTPLSLAAWLAIGAAGAAVAAAAVALIRHRPGK